MKYRVVLIGDEFVLREIVYNDDDYPIGHYDIGWMSERSVSDLFGDVESLQYAFEYPVLDGASLMELTADDVRQIERNSWGD